MKTGVISLTIMGLLVALGASGCTATAAPPLKLSERPLWTSKTLGLDDVDAAELLDDRVVMQEYLGDRLVTVDTASGEVVWSVEPEQQLLGGDGEIVADQDGFSGPNEELVITGTAEDWDVIVPYRTDPEDDDVDQQYGVAALSGEDGAVEWKHELATMDDEEDLQELPRPVLASEDVVLLRPWGREVTDNTLTALDAAIGEQLWQQDTEGWPYHAENDIVVTISPDEPPFEAEVPSEWGGGNAMAWDARSGDQLWDLSDEWSEPDIGPVVNGKALVGVEKGVRSAFIAVDVNSGEQLTDLGSDYRGCVTDGDYTVVCQKDEEITTIDTRNHSVDVAALPFDEDAEVTTVSVHQGQVFVEAVHNDKRKVHIVDNAGNHIGRDAPGYPREVSDEYAMFSSGTGLSYKSTLALYEVVSS